jgi:hypothetical protein
VVECCICSKEHQEIYVVNPRGGYGWSEETVIGIECLHKPDAVVVYERLRDLGVLESRDLKSQDRSGETGVYSRS